MSPLTRRDFLRTSARAVIAGGALAALPEWARAVAGPPPELIVRNEWPEHWETTLDALGHSYLTTNERFFVRSHFPAPRIDMATWRLEVSGLVDRPLSMELAELRGLPGAEADVTIECAGNGRARYPLPNTSGTQWEYGAVGTASWAGFRLDSLLERAGVQPEAKHVWFEAADQAPLPTVPRFLRSIPLEKAMKDVLLAHRMNGEALPRLHGGPLRAIVPGWYGMASTKWLTRVRLEAEPSDNHFMVKGYRYVLPGADPAAAPPVEEMKVKSVITRPRDGAKLPVGVVRVQGFAWTGPSGVKIVEISLDGGKTWRPAGFWGDTSPFAWRAWATQFEKKEPGTVKILARATDHAGEVQPLEATPNLSGYANNSMHQVRISVRAA